MCLLHFTDAPQVNVSQSIFNVVTGESVSIGYSITEGNPPNSNFSVFWNGVLINPVQYDMNATYITFDDISSNFRGNYVIRVSNVAGSGEATFVFNERSGMHDQQHIQWKFVKMKLQGTHKISSCYQMFFLSGFAYCMYTTTANQNLFA